MLLCKRYSFDLFEVVDLAWSAAGLGDLTAELRAEVRAAQAFRFEWSSPSQGQKLLLCGDWNRKGRRTSRVLFQAAGCSIRKTERPMTTAERVSALDAARRLLKAWAEGSCTNQRVKPVREPASSLLGGQRRTLTQWIRARDGGHGVKSKHLRHANGLFDYLDERRLKLDCVNAIKWAQTGISRNTDNYADRLRVAQWACQQADLPWIVPAKYRAKKPVVSRPWVDFWVNSDLSRLFELVEDPLAQTFFRVVAATGCRPSEVLCFDWDRWHEKGRQNCLDGYSRKSKKDFTDIAHPVDWILDIDISLLRSEVSDADLRDAANPIASDYLTKMHSKNLRCVQKYLDRAGALKVLQKKGIKKKPDWTDFRHLYTVRFETDGGNRRVGALSQAHSEKMASAVYLRHGEKAQVEAEARRMSKVSATEAVS